MEIVDEERFSSLTFRLRSESLIKSGYFFWYPLHTRFGGTVRVVFLFGFVFTGAFIAAWVS